MVFLMPGYAIVVTKSISTTLMGQMWWQKICIIAQICSFLPKFAQNFAFPQIFSSKRVVVVKKLKMEQNSYHHCLPWCILHMLRWPLKVMWPFEWFQANISIFLPIARNSIFLRHSIRRSKMWFFQPNISIFGLVLF